MGEGQEKMLQSPCTARRNDDSYEKHKDQWVILGVGGGGGEDDTGNTSSLDNPSSTNGSTASSLDMVDDDASSCSSSNSNGPLFELSELLSHLPIKRGLSKYYEGKSQSFTSLSRVASMEDLAKKETGCRRKMKGSKSYANGLAFHKSYRLPKPVIAKKVSSRVSIPSFCFPDRRGSFLNRARPPPIPLRKKFRCITS
ncbi:OXIDATIVE STRESS 3 [Salix purpurea]|uniref:OXIDATIVE STRESS 3 n=2 Tax=Salix purpurea TaxID=77065 RepID=A0A9Q0TH44_SALPP|nr:OXIDATIVE STRESS 3 [Salix purpurea]